MSVEQVKVKKFSDDKQEKGLDINRSLDGQSSEFKTL